MAVLTQGLPRRRIGSRSTPTATPVSPTSSARTCRKPPGAAPRSRTASPFAEQPVPAQDLVDLERGAGAEALPSSPCGSRSPSGRRAWPWSGVCRPGRRRVSCALPRAVKPTCPGQRPPCSAPSPSPRPRRHRALVAAGARARGGAQDRRGDRPGGGRLVRPDAARGARRAAAPRVRPPPRRGPRARLRPPRPAPRRARDRRAWRSFGAGRVLSRVAAEVAEDRRHVGAAAERGPDRS